MNLLFDLNFSILNIYMSQANVPVNFTNFIYYNLGHLAGIIKVTGLSNDPHKKESANSNT